MSTSLKILIIDEREDDFLIAKGMLKEAKGQVDDVQWAASYEAGREAVHSDQFHAILINDHLGIYSGIDLIREANERGCSAPLILYTDQRSFEGDIEAMQAGATLSITKDEATPLLLERAIRYAIERKQHETSLRTNEAHPRESHEQLAYQAVILQNIHDAVIATDPNRIITFWNHGAVQLYGWTTEEALGHPVGELIPSEMTEEQRQAAMQELLEKGNFTGSMIQYGRNGRKMWVEGRVIALSDTSGKITSFVTANREITELKQVQNELITQREALRESEEKYRTFFENLRENVWLFEIVRNDQGQLIDLVVRDANPPALASVGLEREMVLGRLAGELFPGEALEGVLFNLPNMLETGEPWIDEQVYNNRHFHYTVFRMAHNMIAISSQDVTERHEAEQALHESRERLERAQQIAHLGSWELDLIRNQLTWSDEVYRIFGLQPGGPPEEFGATYDAFLDHIHPDDRMAVNAAYSNSLKENRDSYEIEHRVVRKSTGEIRFVHEKCEHFRDSAGRLIRSIGMVQDITERKQAEAAVQAEQAKLEAVVENLEIGVMIGEADGSQTSMNSAALRLFDLPSTTHIVSHPEQFLQSYEIRFLDGRLTPPEERPAIRAMRGDYFSNLELQVHNLQTGRQWIGSWSATPIRTLQDELQLLVITVQDITERKQAEQNLRESESALRQSEARLRDFLESTHDSFFSLDRNWRVQYINRRFAEILGINVEDILGAIFWEAFPGYLGTPIEQNYRKVMAERIPTHFIAGGVYSNAWYEVSVYPAADGITVFASNRTEEHRALNALQESEQKYRSLFENSAEAIFLTNTDGSVQAANPAACAIFGWTEEEMMRLGRAGLLDTSDPRMAEALEIRKQTGRFQSIEYTGIRKGGERFPVEVDSIVLPGEPIRAFVILRDITERKRAEQALQASENRLRKLVEGNIIGVDVRDAAGHLKDANTTLLTLVGYTCDELQAGTMSIKNLTPPEFWSIDQQAVEEALASGSCQPYEKAFIHKDGHIIPIMVGYTRIDETSDNFIGFVLDLTELKQAQATLQDYANKLKHSNAELEQFAFVASHDLQEPLRKIRLFGTAIQQKLNGTLDEETQDNFKRMLNASERMQAMIQDLLELSRVNTQGRPFEQVDLNAVAAEVVSDLETLVISTRGQVVVGPLPTIEADPIQIHQVLQNLIGNALKFHRRGVAPLIKVSGATLKTNGKKDELVSIQVQDNGIGFEEGQFERILQPFQRLHGRSEYEGNGIGLAIVKKIIDRHRGLIAAYSVPDEGSTFKITLPIHQSN